MNANFESPGGKLHCKGQFTATTTVKDKQVRIMLFVVAGPTVNNILRHEASVAMGFVKRLEELKSSAPTEVGLLNIKPIQIPLKDSREWFSVP